MSNSTEQGFTPGPWSQSHREREDGTYATEVYCSQGRTIATLSWYAVPHKGGTASSRPANARLIAEAPAMVDALSTARGNLSYVLQTVDLKQVTQGALRNTLDKIDALLARATGAA